LYNRLRSGQSRSGSHSLLLGALGRDLRRLFRGYPGVCLVEHQLVARILAPICRTWFLHGDIAAPPECVVPEVERVFVPLDQTREGFLRRGAAPERVVATGLMIEPALADGCHSAFHLRLDRYAGTGPLHVALFSSGAEPEPHLRRIELATPALIRAGLRATVFCGTSRRLLDRFVRSARRAGIVPRIDDRTPAPGHGPLTLVVRPDRRAATACAIELLAGFDCFVAPTHERVNWALGLGLPLLALFPMIGTHARMNYDFCFEQNVAYPLRSESDAQNLGLLVRRLRASGALANMARCGFGRFPLNGPQQIAAELAAPVNEP
jgi:hypothetical protein